MSVTFMNPHFAVVILFRGSKQTIMAGVAKGFANFMAKLMEFGGRPFVMKSLLFGKIFVTKILGAASTGFSKAGKRLFDKKSLRRKSLRDEDFWDHTRLAQ